MVKPTKPLGRKCYGSIPHLPGSKRGPADRGANEGVCRIMTERCRKGDLVIVQEKLDGSCVSVANIDGELKPMTRSGYHALDSHYEQHHRFARWVNRNLGQFKWLLPGERVVGEWLAQAHGTIYNDIECPFVAFDLMRESERETFHQFLARIHKYLPLPKLIWCVPAPLSIDIAWQMLCDESAGTPEGLVYRVEREGRVDQIAKWVRSDYVPGKYLTEITGSPTVWNWTDDNDE